MMRRGEPRDLSIARRYGQISAQYSIQDVYDLLVELITNADDSYRRAYDRSPNGSDRGPILIELERHRGDRSSIITVSDRAEGIRDLDAMIGRIGDRTSIAGDRGFMARGLKDCAALGHITVETIADGVIGKAEITPDFKYVPYSGGRKKATPTKADRRRLGIPHAGTRVRVALNPSVVVPQKQTLIRELPWHYALRDIFDSGTVKIAVGNEKPVLVRYAQPEAELVADEEFEVGGYPGKRARFRLYRSTAPLEDPPDRRFRRSGILVCGSRAVHECSFLDGDLERDPAADNYFGRLDAPAIDDLAAQWDERREAGEDHPPDNRLLLFDPNRRDGLQRNHPFTQALFGPPVDILKLQFDKEKQARKQHAQTVESKETTARLRRLAREASQFMREKLEDLDSVSPDDRVNETSFIEKGVVLVPSFTQMRVGEEKRFYARVNGALGLALGTASEVTLSKAAEGCLELIAGPTDLEPDIRQPGVQRSTFTLKALAVARRVQVGCRVDELDEVFAEVQVLPEQAEDLQIPDDFSFHRQRYTVKHGGRRTLRLRARIAPPPAAPVTVTFRVDDDSAVVLRKRTNLRPVAGTTYLEATVVVEGRRLNSEAKIVAEAEGRRATVAIAVVAREDDGVELDFKLVPHSLGQNWRAIWDRREPNKLLITTKHESISRYLGSADEGYPGQHLPPFRVLLAELIADNVCRRIVEEHLRVLPHEFDGNRIYLQHSRLMKEFTPIAHRVMLSNPGDMH